MRLAHLIQAKGCVDDGLDLARLNQGPDLLTQLLGDRGLDIICPGPECGACDGQSAHHQLRTIDLGLTSAQQGNHYDTTIISQAANVTADILTSHHIQNYIHPTTIGVLTDELLVFLSAVIDADGT